jgi:hypothetical protein
MIFLEMLRKVIIIVKLLKIDSNNVLIKKNQQLK